MGPFRSAPPPLARRVALAAVFLASASHGTRTVHKQRSGRGGVAADQTLHLHAPETPATASVEKKRTEQLVDAADRALETSRNELDKLKEAGFPRSRPVVHNAHKADDQKLLNNMDLMLRAPKEGSSKQPQGVSMQVPEKEMTALLKQLSSRCEKQFSGILNGSQPPIHTFGDTGTNASQAHCTELEGSLCHTTAQIKQNKTDSARRTMESTVEVSGNGCLPHQCTAQDDLGVLVAFMQAKAKDTVPGTDVRLELSVDCSESGGGQITLTEGGARKPVRGVRTGSRNAALRPKFGALALAVATGFLAA